MGALVSDPPAHPVRRPSRTALTAVADHSPRYCQIPDQTIGTKRSLAHSGAVTLIQRFGSAANLNIYLHCLVLDGVYCSTEGVPVFHEVRGPSAAELEALLSRIIQRILRLLTRTGYLIEERGMTYLAQAESDRALTPLQAAACTYRIALGPRAGRKVLSLQTVLCPDLIVA